MNDQAANLIDVIDSFDTAMLITGTVDTQPSGRPMSIAKSESDGTLWFITADDSLKAHEVRDDANAMVTLQSKTAHALVHGTAALVDDPARLQKLWSKAAEIYFPEGPEAEHATLLRFTPTHGQYWDLRGTKGLTYAAQAAKALWNGKSIDDVPGTSGEAVLH